MIHYLPLDSDIEERLKEFNERLPQDQKIVHMTTSSKYLFVSTEKKDVPNRITNLLVDELTKRGPNQR